MPENLKKGWTRVAFGEMVKHIAERVEPTPEDGEKYVGLEHLESGSLTVRRWGAEVALIGTKLRMRKGDILFARRNAYLRRVAIAPHDGLFSAHGMIVCARPTIVLPEFLPFFMQSDVFMNRAEQISVGSLSPTINWKTLAEEAFALPPLEEQRRIAEMLEALQDVREAIDKAERRLQDLRRAHLSAYFDPRFRDGVPLPTVARILAGNTPSKAASGLWGGSLPWASGKDLKTRLLKSTEDGLTEEGWAQATTAPRSAVLVVVRGMILAHTFPVARCEQDTAFNQDLRALIAKDQVNPDYLLLWTEWAAPWFLSRCSASSHGTKRIEGQVFDRALVPVPDLDEQLSFVEEHQKIIDAIGLLDERKSLQRGLAESLLKTEMEGRNDL
jgi:type I restriction enzyme, S subunit